MGKTSLAVDDIQNDPSNTINISAHLNILTHTAFGHDASTCPSKIECNALSKFAGMTHESFVYTESNKAVFYSGGEGKNHKLAKEYVQLTGKQLIDFTYVGIYLDSLSIYDACPYEYARETWNILSKTFAQNVNGEVAAFVEKSYRTSVFCQTELPELLKNKKVTGITICTLEKGLSEYEQKVCEENVISLKENAVTTRITIQDNCLAQSNVNAINSVDAMEMILQESSQPQTSAASNMRSNLLTKISSTSTLFFNYIPRALQSIFEQSKTDDLCATTVEAVENLDETIDQDVLIKEKIARTNPNGAVVFDAMLTMGMFATAKIYQWCRGEDKDQSQINKGEMRLLTAGKVCLEKEKLINDFNQLSNDFSNIAVNERFGFLAQSNQAEFYQEAQASFDVLREQLNEFVVGKATIGNLLDIRHCIKDLNEMLKEVNQVLGYDRLSPRN